MEKLYKVTKTRYHIPWQETEYRVDRRQVDYRTNKGAVTLAFKSAQDMNAHADHYEREHPGRRAANRYEVTVEIADLPEFRTAGWCDEHGVQPWLAVPGLASEPTCIECI